jgi:hypothetical protein
MALLQDAKGNQAAAKKQQQAAAGCSATKPKPKTK